MQTTLTAIGEMFEEAKSIMNWLGECAKVRFLGWWHCAPLFITLLF